MSTQRRHANGGGACTRRPKTGRGARACGEGGQTAGRQRSSDDLLATRLGSTGRRTCAAHLPVVGPNLHRRGKGDDRALPVLWTHKGRTTRVGAARVVHRRRACALHRHKTRARRPHNGREGRGAARHSGKAGASRGGGSTGRLTSFSANVSPVSTCCADSFFFISSRRAFRQGNELQHTNARETRVGLSRMRWDVGLGVKG